MSQTQKTFPAYTFQPREIKAPASMFDAETQQFKTITSTAELAPDWVHQALVSLTLAAEAGTVHESGWVRQLFSTAEIFEEFLYEFVTQYSSEYRVIDRYWQALATLAGVEEDKDFVDAQQIADALRAKAVETGQV